MVITRDHPAVFDGNREFFIHHLRSTPSYVNVNSFEYTISDEDVAIP